MKECTTTKVLAIETFFGKVCGQYGHESGLVKRQSTLTASKMAQALVLGSVKTPTRPLKPILPDVGGVRCPDQ
jgi:hypothetical protein